MAKDAQLMSTDKMNKAGALLAQQNAMERSGKLLSHGCRLFAVEKGWESAMIRNDRSVAACDTLLSLEQAVRDEGVKVIFIPAGAIMTDADIEKICKRNAAVKTLFREVEIS